MTRKKKPGESQKDKGVLQEDQSFSQEAQRPISEEEAYEFVKQWFQQHNEGSTSSQQTKPQTQGLPIQTRSQTKGSSGIQTSGSSTQKTQTESSSQRLASNKPGKMTLDSYEKKLPTNTWGEILAKKDEKALALSLIASPLQAMSKQEYDSINHQFSLQLAQKQPSQAQKQLVTTPVISQIDTPYLPKTNKVKNILQIEPEFFHQTPNQVALNVFPSGFHFKPTDLRKTREYYELILVHSESIALTHKTDKDDETLITHSTLQILKVLTPDQWGQSLNKPKFFGINFEPNGYTYWDYCEAWYNVFWAQNRLFKHTWFIYFKSKTKYTFPQWFLQWWDFFGPIPEIFPPNVQKALELFQKKFKLDEDPFPIDLHYFSKLSVSWIFSWQYRFSHLNRDSPVLPILQRIPFVRWWAKFDQARIDSRAVELWFKENPNFLSTTEQSRFLNQRAQIQSKLASVTNKPEFIKQLSFMLKQLQQDEAQVNTQASSSTAPGAREDRLVQSDDEDFIIDLNED